MIAGILNKGKTKILDYFHVLSHIPAEFNSFLWYKTLALFPQKSNVFFQTIIIVTTEFEVIVPILGTFYLGVIKQHAHKKKRLIVDWPV